MRVESCFCVIARSGFLLVWHRATRVPDRVGTREAVRRAKTSSCKGTCASCARHVCQFMHVLGSTRVLDASCANSQDLVPDVHQVPSVGRTGGHRTLLSWGCCKDATRRGRVCTPVLLCCEAPDQVGVRVQKAIGKSIESDLGGAKAIP